MPDAITQLITDLEGTRLAKTSQPIVVPVDDFVAALNEIETAIGGGIVPSTIVLTNSHILVGNVSNVGADVAMSGDATISNTGHVTVNGAGGVAFGSAAFDSAAAFDAAGSAAAAVVTAEAYTDSQLNGGTPGTISPPAIALPTSKIVKGDGSAHGSAVFDLATIEFVFDGGGSTLTGKTRYLWIDFDFQITEVTLLGDESGSITCGIAACTYAQFDAGSTHPAFPGDSITASDTPALATATKYQDAVLTGWTTTFTGGTVLAFKISGITAIQVLTIALKVSKL
jgi:hypothetical protein